MRTLRIRSRILILLVLLFLSIVFWFSKFGGVQVDQPSVISDGELPVPQSVAYPTPLIIAGPEPSTFEVFLLPDRRDLVRQITCADALYTVLVFPAGVDYRYAPRTAVYNSANTCERTGRVEVRLNLATLTVPAGDYYMIVADQGAAGTWYNPR